MLDLENGRSLEGVQDCYQVMRLEPVVLEFVP